MLQRYDCVMIIVLFSVPSTLFHPRLYSIVNKTTQQQYCKDGLARRLDMDVVLFDYL